MSLFRKKTTVVDAPPAYAFCEPVSASATSYWHIRKVGEEGLKLGGGIPGDVLCGSERMARGGWDLHAATREEVIADSTPREGDGRVFVCPDCATAYLNLPA